MNEARPHATAWLPPLPPAVTVRELAVKVSPGPGQRGVDVTKSMFREPMMQMWAWEVAGVEFVSLMAISEALLLSQWSVDGASNWMLFGEMWIGRVLLSGL